MLLITMHVLTSQNLMLYYQLVTPPPSYLLNLGESVRTADTAPLTTSTINLYNRKSRPNT